MKRSEAKKLLSKLMNKFQFAKQERAAWKAIYKRSWPLLTHEEKRSSHLISKLEFERYDEEARRLREKIIKLQSALTKG